MGREGFKNSSWLPQVNTKNGANSWLGVIYISEACSNNKNKVPGLLGGGILCIRVDEGGSPPGLNPISIYCNEAKFP